MRIHSPQITGSAANTNIVLTTVTSSISVLSSSFASTASSADNLTVRGTLTAQTINVQTITSSIEFVTGSTRNGSLLANTHEFTGSVLMTGSLTMVNSNITIPYDNTAFIIGNNNDIGIVKKFGSTGFYAFGNASDFTIAQSNAANILPSNTFTNKLTINTTTGVLTNSNGITAGNVGADNFGIEVLNELAMVKKSGGGAFIAYPANRDFFIAQSTANSVGASNTFNRRLTINQTSGNVLINTATDSGFRLDVNGTARINGNTTVTGSIDVSGSITSNGTITAQTLVVQTVTSSIEFVTGSTRNGSLLTNTHQFTGSVGITGSLLVNGGSLAVQDGTILYHTIAWFTPSSTVSTSGTTVTSVGTQFTSAMVGAKLTISGESRIITAFTSTTQVTVASAYSQNYSGVASGSWSVYSISFKNYELKGTTEYYNAQYSPTGILSYSTQKNSAGYTNNVIGNQDSTAYTFADQWTFIKGVLRPLDGMNMGNVSIAYGEGGTSTYGYSSAGVNYYQISTSGAVRLMSTTLGNIVIGSSTIDNGYRLQVNGSGSASGSLFVSGSSSFTGSVNVLGNITSTGTITAQTLVVQTVTSSIEFITGSTRNGSTTANTHEFTGSVSISGSLVVNGSNPILTNQTSSMSVSTASFALTASYISGSGAGVGFPFSGSAIITGSLFVSGSTISGSFKGDGSQITGLTAGGKIHTQASSASTWTVSHNLGVQYPNVTVYDNNNNVIIPQTIVATDANTLTLTFGSAVAGYAVAGIGGIINVQGRTTQQYFTASTTWSFAHNLGDKYVSLQAFDDAFEMMIPTTIRLVDFTSSLMLFDSASSGYAVATIGGDLPAISSSYAGYTLQIANSAPYSASWVAAANVAVTTAVSSSFAATASSADNLTVRGTLTAQTINVQTITSSIDFVTGSAKFGSLSTNIHQFTGSVSITGSADALLNVSNGILYVSASGNVGIGVTSISPISTYKTLEIRGATGGGIKIGRTGYNPLNIQQDGGDAYLNNVANGAIYFYTNDSEKMSITSGGYVRINTTVGVATLNLKSQSSGAIIKFQNNAGGDGTIFAYGTSTSLDYAFNTYSVGNAFYIANAGNVGIGTSSPGTKLHIANGDVQIQNANQTTGDFSQAQSLAFSQETGAYGAGIKAIREAWSSMPFALTFLTNSVAGGYTEKMRINSVGSVGAGGSSTNIYNASDIRLKKNINTITYGLNTVSALNPVKFNWADGFDLIEADKILLGFIAQEVQTVIPEAVESFGSNVDLNGTTIENTLRVNEKFIIPVLVKAIQELSAKVTLLENK
jgi:hypothetical protein